MQFANLSCRGHWNRLNVINALAAAVLLSACGGSTSVPCKGSCNAPPVSSCSADGTSLTAYSAAGTCGSKGTCTYVPSFEICQFGCANAQCNAAVCVETPCPGVTCATPPANVCADANTLTVYNLIGTCGGGSCTYASSPQICPAGCANGQCTGSPCLGVTCGVPPANSCADANTLTIHNFAGTCDGGACSYASAALTCQFGCANGLCNNSPCLGVTCSLPPANYCLADNTTLTVYGALGTCGVDGSCTYASAPVTCQFGCANGLCNNNPCQAVTCSIPPANACADADTLTVYNAVGACTGNGACTYASSALACQFGCAGGRCNINPCQGVTCSIPPANFCADANTLTVYTTAGTCSGNGVCAYAWSPTTCQFGCANGQCNNSPCQGVTCSIPPANYCLADNTTLTVYNAAGTCGGNGSCTYASSPLTCQFGCASGKCKNNPCQGVTCSAPPANACADANTLTVYNVAGACGGNGSCTYASSPLNCQFGCASGKCNNNPCAGVTCTTPTANYCLADDVTLTVFSAIGTCGGGSCTYATLFRTCQFGCANGLCNHNPCQGMTCTVPPANHCADANTLTVYNAIGTCGGNGSCAYASAALACPSGCVDGQCNNSPCEGVTCSIPPANACADASTLTVYSSTGTCGGNGACLYASSPLACPSGCASGQCNNSPCAGVTCIVPPANYCLADNTTLTVYSPVGTCGGGSCLYASAPIVCQFGCVNGQCTNNPCLGVTCILPPANSCADTSTLTVYAAAGTCGGNGSCAYASSPQICAFGCANGLCNSNPCQGVTCSTPPANSCADATTLTVFNAVGICGGGACTYASSPRTCQFGCANGLCNVNPCQGVTCSVPPANYCLADNTTLTVYSATGTCGGMGSCAYASLPQTCAFGCANGLCNSNPCQGLTCSTAPANACADANTLTVYSATGTCGGIGSCTYASSPLHCASGCASGQCNNNPCVGVTCVIPPANYCLADNTTLTVYSPVGTCGGGSCTYASSPLTCQFGCASGQCNNNPCQGVTCSIPPANSCADASTLTVYSATGTCGGIGSCTYTSAPLACPSGCASGKCNNNPCQGVTCSIPPANSCADANTLTVYNAAGICDNGSCTYASVPQACTFGCAGGQCSNNPCQGVTCTIPPANYCLVDNTTLTVYSAIGACGGGSCTYASSPLTCQFGCASGQCKNNPCAGVTCTTPPANACTDANTLTAYVATGTCGGSGTCTYASTPLHCASGCASGQCNTDPCAGVTCTTPLANYCLADNVTLTVYAAPGTCSGNGLCTYTSSTQTCQFGCVNGQCNGFSMSLGRADLFAITAGAGMTSTGITVANGDVALYPTPTCTDATGLPGDCAINPKPASATGLTVYGAIFFAADAYDSGATAHGAMTDLNVAWTRDLAMTHTLTVGGQLASANSYVPGVYYDATLTFAAGGVATLDAQGNQDALFIFQVGTDFTVSGTTANPSRIMLTGSAHAKNVWFVVGNDVVIGGGTIWSGNVLAGRNITVNTGAQMTGRALAGAAPGGAGAVSILDGVSISVP